MRQEVIQTHVRGRMGNGRILVVARRADKPSARVTATVKAPYES